MHTDTRIKPVTYGLALYLMLAVFDTLFISAIGSMLKIAALVPLLLLPLNFKELRLRLHPLFGLQLSFWLLALISLFYTVSIDRTLAADKTLTLNLMLVLILGTLVPYNEKELDFLQKAFLLSGWIQIALTLIFADVSAAGRLTLRFGQYTQDQNNNNTYFLYTFSCHCYYLMSKQRRKHLAAVLFMFAMVLFSGSRGALVAFVMTFVFHILLYFRNSKYFMRTMLVVILLMVLTGIAFDFVLEQMPESVSVRYSLDYLSKKGTVGRSRVWRYLLNVVKNSSIPRILFGYGYGSTIVVNQFNALVAHNLYLDNLITLGVLGTILQIASQLTVCHIFRKRKKYELLGAYVGMIGMCMSLSLTACKPLWNMILIALAIDCNETGDPGTERT